jgi:hypothetical protein
MERLSGRSALWSIGTPALAELGMEAPIRWLSKVTTESPGTRWCFGSCGASDSYQFLK